MFSVKTKFIATSLLFSSIFGFGLSYKESGRDQWLKHDSYERSISSLDTLTLGAYNVENLFHEAVVPPQNDFLNLLPFANANPVKPRHKLKDMARAILENKFDVLVVSEVESLHTLQLLNKYYLQDLYQAFLLEGNDERGIDVGFFVKKDLPFFIDIKTNKGEKWQDPTQGGKTGTLFSRDIPELHVRANGEQNPLFVLMGTHYKSKISRKDDPKSCILRKAQVDRTAEIFKRLDKEFNNEVPLFIGGDFNGEVSHEKEFVAFHENYKLYDAFDSVSPALTAEERFTHLYFPKGQPMERTQLDGLMFDAKAKNSVLRAFPYRYRDIKGNVLPIPKTFKERDRIPSDHYPVVVEVDTKSLWD